MTHFFQEKIYIVTQILNVWDKKYGLFVTKICNNIFWLGHTEMQQTVRFPYLFVFVLNRRELVHFINFTFVRSFCRMKHITTTIATAVENFIRAARNMAVNCFIKKSCCPFRNLTGVKCQVKVTMCTKTPSSEDKTQL